MLDFSLQQWAAVQNLGLQLLPFLAHPHLHSRLRRVDNVSFQRGMDLGKSIPATAMITESTVRMKDRLAAVKTFSHQFSAAPHAKMLTLRREGEIAALGAYSILVGRHWSSYKGVASSSLRVLMERVDKVLCHLPLTSNEPAVPGLCARARTSCPIHPVHPECNSL